MLWVGAERGRELQALPYRTLQLYPSISCLSLVGTMLLPFKRQFITWGWVMNDLKSICLRKNTTFWLMLYKSMFKPFGSFSWKDLYLRYEGALSLLPCTLQVSLSYWGNTYRSCLWTCFFSIILFRPAAKISYSSMPCLWSTLFTINTLSIEKSQKKVIKQRAIYYKCNDTQIWRQRI